jgi:Domain of unknown function (DUF1877)
MTYLRLPEAEGGGDPGAVARSIFANRGWRDQHAVLSIAGTWQGLHYLITGDPWEGPHPEADVVCGGRLLTEDGTEELGLDVIYLAPQRVKPAADHLTATKFGQIAGRYDAARMAQLGVQGADEWARKPVEAVRDRELRHAYDNLVRFFQLAAGEGQAIFKAMG